MNISMTLIVLAAYAVIHVLSYLGKEAAKRKEKERQREAAQKRQMEAGRMTPPAAAPPRPLSIETGFGSAGGQMDTRGTQQPARRTGTPVDDVAARRREQLDQLRQRREGKRAPAAAPTTPASGPTISPIPVPRNVGSARDDMRARQMEAERRRRAELEANRAKQVRAVQQQRDIESSRERREQALLRKSQQSADQPLTRGQTVLVTDPLAKGNALRAGIAAQLNNRDTLRQFFVIRELLDPPLAMRDNER